MNPRLLLVTSLSVVAFVVGLMCHFRWEKLAHSQSWSLWSVALITVLAGLVAFVVSFARTDSKAGFGTAFIGSLGVVWLIALGYIAIVVVIQRYPQLWGIHETIFALYLVFIVKSFFDPLMWMGYLGSAASILYWMRYKERWYEF